MQRHTTQPRLVAIAAAAMLLATAHDGQAAPIAVPSGLNPGDEYRLVLVTSTTRQAFSTDIADYNAFVTGVASSVPELAALGTTWTAIGSTATVDARDNTNTNPLSATGNPIYDLGDFLIASGNADLWDGSIGRDIRLIEDGTDIALLGLGTTGVWTGSRPDGTADPGSPALGEVFLGCTNPCNPRTGEWTPFFPNQPSRWVQGAIAGPFNELPLYAISGTLVVPEPGAAMLLPMSLVTLAALRRNVQRRVEAPPGPLAPTTPRGAWSGLAEVPEKPRLTIR